MDQFLQFSKRYRQLSEEDRLKWGKHFNKLVRHQNGTSHVSDVEEYERYFEILKALMTLYFGDRVCISAKITGSVAQILKCESANSKGDIDIVFLSDFPAISKSNLDFVLVPGSEIGYCKIKTLDSHGKYPTITESGEHFIKADSLRQLELVWWPDKLQWWILMLDVIGKVTKTFHTYEPPEDGAAISITWSSSFSTVGTLDKPGELFFNNLITSYRLNILPLLEHDLRLKLEEFFRLVIKIIHASVYYIESDVHKLSLHELSGFPSNITEYGVLNFVIESAAVNLETRNVSVTKPELNWLKIQCLKIKDLAQREQIDVGVWRDTWHRKNGSFDIIPSISCEGFPKEAMPWSSRVGCQNWPDQEIVEKVVHAELSLAKRLAWWSCGEMDKVSKRFSQLSENDRLRWDKHFNGLVKCTNGASHVSHIDDYERYCSIIGELMTLFLGNRICNNAMITGSVAQNLKCETANSKGDLDVVLLSDFPAISESNLKYVLVPGNEVGYCKIKAMVNNGRYPTVKINGEHFIKADSLRQLELIWWPDRLRESVLLLDLIGKKTEIFNKYEPPEDGAAICISWSSSFSTFGTTDRPGIRFYRNLIASYQQNIFPILEDGIRMKLEEFFRLLMKFIYASVYYIESDVCNLPVNYGEFSPKVKEYGIMYFAMECSAFNLKTENFHVNQSKVLWLRNQCQKIQDFAQKVVVNVDVVEETWHRKHGSFDFIPAIACEGFPKEAKPWLSRVERKNWPSREIVEEVMHAGYQVIPKASKAPGKKDVKTSFRYSFNDAETILCQNLTETQRQTFRVLKMFFYEKLQRDPKIVETYHLKTLLFWFIEESPSELWKEENLSLCCMGLLEKLAGVLKGGSLRHYFIPEMDLFEYIDKHKLIEMADIVEGIIRDPISSTGEVMTSIVNYYNQKISQEEDGNHEFQSEEFFKKADKFYEEAIKEIESKDEEFDQIENRDQELQTNERKMENLESQIKTDEKMRRVLRFCSDLIFSVNLENEIRLKNLKVEGKKNLRISPLLCLILSVLPVSKEIMPETSDLILNDAKQGKIWKQIKSLKRFATVVLFLLDHNLIGILLGLITKANHFSRIFPVATLGKFINPFQSRRISAISRGPTGQLFSFILASGAFCVGFVLLIAACVLFVIFRK